MKIGVVFPQTEIGSDPAAIRDDVQAAEGLGYTHLLAYDHVLGADTSFHEGWIGSYTSNHMFHEPLIAFSYMAAITERLAFLNQNVKDRGRRCAEQIEHLSVNTMNAGLRAPDAHIQAIRQFKDAVGA